MGQDQERWWRFRRVNVEGLLYIEESVILPYFHPFSAKIWMKSSESGGWEQDFEGWESKMERWKKGVL